MLALMEEKLSKQQLAKKQAHDKKVGFEAIINGEKATASEKNRLQSEIGYVEKDMQIEVRRLDMEYKEIEQNLVKEVHSRTIKREANVLDALQKEQIQERSEIFSKFLPETLIAGLNEE